MTPITIDATEFSSNFYFMDDKMQPRSFHISDIVPLISPVIVDEISYNNSVKVAGIMYGVNITMRKGKVNPEKWKHKIKTIDIVSLEVKKKTYPLTKV